MSQARLPLTPRDDPQLARFSCQLHLSIALSLRTKPDRLGVRCEASQASPWLIDPARLVDRRPAVDSRDRRSAPQPLGAAAARRFGTEMR
jgi:hypothetical protein